MKIRMLPLVTFLGLSACGAGEQEPENVVVETIQEDQMPMDEMPGMAGMGGMRDNSMMQQMQAHIAEMAAADADGMTTMMPEHRQMAANMLAQMNREMEQMNMAGDTAWTATVDSLRQDLTLMPEMTAQELQELMPAHHARVTRLLEMHGSMMGNMRM